MKLLYFLSLAVFLLPSCQSEYQKQLKQARKLVLSEQQIKSSVSSDYKGSSQESLKAISEELRFQARMSGNEDAFMKEVDKYRRNIKIEDASQSPMITRFP